MQINFLHLLIVPIVCLVGSSLISCNGGGHSDGDKPLVVATTTMAADLARVIGGDRVEIQGLMGPDVDPHSYIPRIGDSRLLEQADLIVYECKKAQAFYTKMNLAPDFYIGNLNPAPYTKKSGLWRLRDLGSAKEV